MTGIFQNNKNFKLRPNGSIQFNDDGVVAFVEDLTSKNIKSGYAIADALNEVSTNAPHVGQLKSNYARELTERFARTRNNEMTVEEIIETITEPMEPVAPPMPLLTPEPSVAEEPSEAGAPASVGEPAGAIVQGIPISKDTQSSIPVDSYREITKANPTKKSFNDIFDNYWGTYNKLKSTPQEKDPLRIYAGRPGEYLLLGTTITKDKFKDGFIDLYGTKVPLSDELIKLLKSKSSDLTGSTQSKNLGAIISLVYKNNPTAFNRDNKRKSDYIEAPWRTPIGSGVFISGKGAEQRFKVLLGQYKAGNNSKILKTELKNLSDALYKNNLLSKSSNLKIQKL
jgi:hypothetical protein